MFYGYELKWGTWMLMHDNRVVHATDDLTFCYDSETYTMLKHGDRRDMEKWADKHRKVLPVNMLILDKNTPAEEVNKILNISGYIKHFIEKFSSPGYTPGLLVNVYA